MSDGRLPLSPQVIANFNNEGVTCLTSGDEAGAWVHFRNALMSASDPCHSNSRVSVRSNLESAPPKILQDNTLRSAAQMRKNRKEAANATMSMEIPVGANSKKRRRLEECIEVPPLSTPIDGVRRRRFSLSCTSNAAHGSCMTTSARTESTYIQSPDKLAAKYSSSATASLIFARGIKIPVISPGEYCFSSEAEGELSICVSIVVYNLALAYHLRGIQEGEESSCKKLFLSRALALYEKCSDMLLVPSRVATAKLTSTNNSVIDLLFMALFNNIAHISFELLNYEKCRSYAGMLLQFMSSIESSDYGDQQVAAIMRRVIVTFFLNSLALRPPTAARAA